MLIAGTFSAAPAAQILLPGNPGPSGSVEVTPLQVTRASAEYVIQSIFYTFFLFYFLLSFLLFFFLNLLLTLYGNIVGLQCFVLVVQETVAVMNIHISIFSTLFFHIGYCCVVVELPVLFSRSYLIIYFKNMYIYIYICICIFMCTC